MFLPKSSQSSLRAMQKKMKILNKTESNLWNCQHYRIHAKKKYTSASKPTLHIHSFVIESNVVRHFYAYSLFVMYEWSRLLGSLNSGHKKQ